MSDGASFVGTVRAGQLVLSEPARWRGFLARHEGKRLSLAVRRERVRRSLQANAYLWGVVYQTIAEWSGHTEDEIHEAMKELFLPKRELLLKATGETLPMGGSTAVLDNVAFSKYVSRVKAWAANCGVYVPEPHEEAAL